jgi:hypothetical protein
VRARALRGERSRSLASYGWERLLAGVHSSQPNARAVVFCQGCSIGCEKCQTNAEGPHGNKGTFHGTGAQAGKIGFGTRYCNATYNSQKTATNPTPLINSTLPKQAWSLNIGATEGSEEDAYRFNPWRCARLALAQRSARRAPRALLPARFGWPRDTLTARCLVCSARLATRQWSMPGKEHRPGLPPPPCRCLAFRRSAISI